MKTTVVVTSISGPNAALRSIAAGCIRHGHDFYVIGDQASPAEFALEGCEFFGLERQRRTDLKFAGLCPARHYARKNIGYLLAMRNRSGLLLETDDDNFPRAAFWLHREIEAEAACVSERGWINVYRYLSDANIWPRGFPLDFVQAETTPYRSLAVERVLCPIQQGMTDENPDVDAIYRLVLPLPVRFRADRRVIVRSGAWCPFNSQNTAWWPDAYPLLYLPAYCSFRMTDIWRSFVAQRIAWENGWGVLFHEPTVYQERNVHKLMHDFEDELPGYLNNRRIAEELDKLTLRPGAGEICGNLLRCYECLVRMNLVGAAELKLLDAWIADYNSIRESTVSCRAGSAGAG